MMPTHRETSQKLRNFVLFCWPAVLAIFIGVSPVSALPPASATALISAARSQIGITTVYDPAYVSLAYPGGDVAPERGVTPM